MRHFLLIALLVLAACAPRQPLPPAAVPQEAATAPTPTNATPEEAAQTVPLPPKDTPEETIRPAPTSRNETLARWTPKPGISWQWQLDGPLDLSVEAAVYDLDLFETGEAVVDDLHQKGKKVICYMSAGSYEDWRPDAKDFPEEVIGKTYEGWEGERWLDIRQIETLAPIMRKRLDLCKEKGFDGVEPDNIDGYDNPTGFDISYVDQLRYNIWLADEAHKRGLSIGLKNDPEQAKDLLPHYDWALTEDCFDEGWCERVAIFAEDGKAVFQAEYTDTDVNFKAVCEKAERLDFSAILKNRDLDAWLETC